MTWTASSTNPKYPNNNMRRLAHQCGTISNTDNKAVMHMCGGCVSCCLAGGSDQDAHSMRSHVEDADEVPYPCEYVHGGVLEHFFEPLNVSIDPKPFWGVLWLEIIQVGACENKP
jgi:hypothetical protein